MVATTARRRRRYPLRDQAGQGSVTAELALGTVSVVTVLGAVLAVGAAGVTQLRCADAAAAGARAAARGDPAGRVEQAATRLAGPAARVTTARDGDVVVVRVTHAVRLPLPGNPRMSVGASAVAAVEGTFEGFGS